MDAKITDKFGVLELTPVQQKGGLYLKREDLYTPFGLGNVNGSKVRQCLFLFTEYLEHGGNKGLVSGASVRSSQIPLGTIVAKQLADLPSVHVIGATKPDTAIRNEQIAIADYFGAKFVINDVAYNPALQSRARKLIENELKGWFYLEYGSAINHFKAEAVDVLRYHMLGAHQVSNIPYEVKTLIVPTGSCNTLISVILGIALYRPDIEILCLQIGPDKREFVTQRLNVLESKLPSVKLHDIKRTYVDLTARWKYTDDVTFNYHGIEMHPTYEGKCFKYLSEHENLINQKSCFWLTGSKPEMRLIDENYVRPREIKLYEAKARA